MNKNILLPIIATTIMFILYVFLFAKPSVILSENRSSSRQLQSAVILQYHHISNHTPNATSTSIRLFKQQLELLKELNFKVLPLSLIIKKLQRGSPLPEAVVALTFDDAYSNFYDNAWPLLQQYGFPATIFVATSHITDEPTEFLSWGQLRELSSKGIEIGSHSDTHNYLARELKQNNSPSRRQKITADIQLSLDKIAQNLSINTKLFAYPYGEYSKPLQKILMQMNLIGLGQHSGPINSNSDFLALPRFPASNDFGGRVMLRDKLLSKPFNNFSSEPQDPFTPTNPPTLKMNFSDKTLKINCFASTQGAIPVRSKIYKSSLSITTKADHPLATGRSRYNCTAAADDDYFFWFSQPWVIFK